MLTAQVDGPNVALVAVSAGLIVAAAVFIAGLWAQRRPPRVEPAGPTDVLGPETPALVDMLTGGFEVNDDAVPATVVDLAHRRWISIEDVTGGHCAIRSRAAPGRGELTPYEARVLRHIESHTVNGVAPAAALTLGDEGVSKRWWTGFVREVHAHGRALGLNRPRWDLRHRGLVWAPITAAGVATIAAANTTDTTEGDIGAWGEPAVIVLGLCFVALAGLIGVAGRITRSEAQTETPAGVEAAARWLGVREWMVESTDFEDKTAASVILWERPLAYATALGLAPDVQRQLPFEADHDRHAWSRAAGYWRRVRISYGTTRPAWGQAPWLVVVRGVLFGLIFGAIGYWALQLAREQVDLSDLPEPWVDRLPVIGMVVAVLALAAVLWHGFRFVLGALDLFDRRTVEGELVRRRVRRTGDRLPGWLQWLIWSGTSSDGSRDRSTRHHLAVDDGSHDVVAAFIVRPTLYGRVREGAHVRLECSPRLGYVTDAVELAPPPGVRGAAINRPTHSAGDDNASADDDLGGSR